MAARIAVVVVSAAVVAFLAVSLASATAASRLSDLQFHTPKPTAADLRRATQMAADAAPLTPGERRDQQLAQMQLRAGDGAAAERLLSGVVAREPQNAEAWLLLSLAAQQQGDAALQRRAAQRVRELVPPVPEP
jgi:Tfp pilus assembly protein PilF